MLKERWRERKKEQQQSGSKKVKSYIKWSRYVSGMLMLCVYKWTADKQTKRENNQVSRRFASRFVRRRRNSESQWWGVVCRRRSLARLFVACVSVWNMAKKQSEKKKKKQKQNQTS